MKVSDRTIKAMRYSAFGAIGGALALSPLGLSFADPDQGPPPPPPATVTATVTAIVAPEECKPIPDGKLPQQAVDYATVDGRIITPTPTPAPENDDAMDTPKKDTPKKDKSDKEKKSDEGSAEQINGSGPFDPYLCDPQAAVIASASEKPDAKPPVDEGPKLGDIPGVKPTLRPYPNQQGDLTEGQGGGSGVTLGTPDPKATPTENPAPRPGAPGPGNGLGGSPRPLG